MTRLSGITFFVVVLLAGASLGGYVRLWQLVSVQANDRQQGLSRDEESLHQLIGEARRSANAFAVLALLGANLALVLHSRALHAEIGLLQAIRRVELDGSLEKAPRETAKAFPMSESSGSVLNRFPTINEPPSLPEATGT